MVKLCDHKWSAAVMTDENDDTYTLEKYCTKGCGATSTSVKPKRKK
jgi:hypothetical protein